MIQNETDVDSVQHSDTSTEISSILLVEDSPVEAEMMRRILVKAGYRVTLAQNGLEGLKALRETPHKLVMSDIKMPLMDGYQLCKEIKQDDILGSIPVVLLTALSEPEDIIEAIKVGADSYINKPFVEDITLENIRSLLSSSITEKCAKERRTGQIEYNGKCHVITPDIQQILNLMLSVYRNTIAQNRELLNTKNQLNLLNESLDQKVQVRTAALQKSELGIRTILNTALDAFISMDSIGLVTEWNVEAEKLFGYSREDVIGKELADLIIPPAYRDAHSRGLKRFMEANEGTYVGGRIEVNAMRNDRSEFPAELSITVIRHAGIAFFSAFMRDITERKQSESKINFLAYHDKLTELPNRELFYDRLSHAISQAKRKHNRLSILFLDLDGFKAVNDNYGHEAGDIVLKSVAIRLQSCVRGVDTVARLGGDEFTVILTEVDKTSDVTNIAEKIIQKLTEPLILYDSQTCGIGVSIGIAMYPENGYELDKLMSSADSAMYESKAHGKNTYTFFNETAKGQADQQPWIDLDKEHLLGVPEIDHQHQELMRMINRLNDAAKQNKSIQYILELFDEICSYTVTHFQTEENLMDQHDFLESEVHKLDHKRLLGEVKYLRTKIVGGGELLVLQYLKDWLLPHILNMDKPFTTYLLQKTS